MTVGLKTPSNYYMELITTFPPRPITNDDELIATQTRINEILDRASITSDDRDYLKVLGTLVYDYEEEHEIWPTLKGIALVKTLINEDNVSPEKVLEIFESEENFNEVMMSKRELTVGQLKKLGELFHISPSAFVD
ncbi:transcriptional regulator [Microcoleus sp. N9_B4]|uniref:transcriptional regulator n=1 Tax=Microcoleus sp. N9_B4 TaxID=3055386 RepID=UPI002FD2906D